jgi:hypothetical protein
LDLIALNFVPGALQKNPTNPETFTLNHESG